MAMPAFDRSKLFKVKSHARAYLKAILKGKETLDEALVLQLFRLHYTVNPSSIILGTIVFQALGNRARPNHRDPSNVGGPVSLRL